MNHFDPVQQILCPYCGEPIEIRLDIAAANEDYTEDCSVCCRPILLHVERDENGEPSVSATRESE
jgi:hypothetical protein